MGTRKYIVTLTSEERERLTKLVSGGQDKAYRIKHANILLAADELGPELPSQEIARVFSCHFNTVTEVCQRFVRQGLDAALDRKKRQAPPTPRKLNGRGEAQLIARRVESRRREHPIGVAAAGGGVGDLGRRKAFPMKRFARF